MACSLRLNPALHELVGHRDYEYKVHSLQLNERATEELSIALRELQQALEVAVS